MKILYKILIFLALFVFSLWYNWATTRIANTLFPGSLSNKEMKDFSIPIIFTSMVLVAPVLETLLGQMAPIELLRRFKKIGKSAVCIAVSALVFAIGHSHSWVYIVVMIVPGILLAGYYWYIRSHDGRTSAFLWVMALHAAVNLVVFLDGYIL